MIDWNVTARSGRPHVKSHVEEREMTVVFPVDVSASGQFGSRQRLKKAVAAEFCCAVLSFNAAKNNIKVYTIAIIDDRLSIGDKLFGEFLSFKARPPDTSVLERAASLTEV